MRSANYRGKHRQTLLARVVSLGRKRRQEWPVLVRHAAITPNMQQIPFNPDKRFIERFGLGVADMPDTKWHIG